MRKRLVMMMLSLALLLAACGGATTDTAPAVTDGGGTDAPTVLVYRPPTWGCCGDWIAYMEENGYTVEIEDVQNLAPVKAEHRVPPMLQSCHTAIVDGYVIEGHVPVADIERLLAERPDVAGLAVPGMPIGSPGMEVAGIEPEPFDVFTFDDAGNVELFAQHAP